MPDRLIGNFMKFTETEEKYLALKTRQEVVDFYNWYAALFMRPDIERKLATAPLSLMPLIIDHPSQNIRDIAKERLQNGF